MFCNAVGGNVEIISSKNVGIGSKVKNNNISKYAIKETDSSNMENLGARPNR